MGIAGFLALNKEPKEQVVFDLLFPNTPMPPSLQPVASGDMKPILGGGIFVIACTISADDLHTLAVNHGFVPAGIEDSPEHWPLSMVNNMIAEQTHADIVVTPDFQCFAMELTNREARIFYDTNRELAVVIGRGAFRRYGTNNFY